MLANRWLTPRSLRSRLSATALAGLTTTIVLTALLFLTASSASEVVAMAQRTHERVRVYTQMEDAARNYQDSSSAGVSDPSPAMRLRVAEARDRLVKTLAEATRLPSNNERERAVGALIARQGPAGFCQSKRTWWLGATGEVGQGHASAPQASQPVPLLQLVA